MTLQLSVRDGDTGLTHHYRGAVTRALVNHLEPDRVDRFFARLMAAGGEHDPSTCERCKAVAAAKARLEAEGNDRLVELAREAGLVDDAPRNGYDRLLGEHMEVWHDTRLAYVNGYNSDDSQTQSRLDRSRAWQRRNRDLTARVKACAPAQLPKLLAELSHEVRRCSDIQDDLLLDRAAREQGRALRALYQLAHDMAMTRYKNIMFYREPMQPQRTTRERVKSTPRALGMTATYESVCSCGHGFVH